MKTQHTPGPWLVIEKQTSCGVVFLVGPEHIANASHGGICLYDDHTTLNPHKEGEQKANAQLIAAAPDLLEACEKILDAYIKADGELRMQDDPLTKEIGIIKTAIKKARGEL